MLDAQKYIPKPDHERDLTDTTIAMCRAYVEKDSLDILFLASHCHPHSEVRLEARISFDSISVIPTDASLVC